ncbi:MAG: phosphatidate cytidylyltransferase [Chloroflexi bacterium]|nr:MAG: phosphatidate cytidylyltransferase [Chloroflexota bacterium]
MPTSMRRSRHISGASVALARAPRRSPIEVADATKPAEPPLAAPRRSNMVVRIATAAVLIAVVLAVLILGSVWVYAAIAVILGAALIEYWNLTRAMAAPAPLWLLFPLSYALLLRDRLPSWADVGFLLAAATVLGLGTLVFVRDWRASLTRWALAVGGSLYLAFTLSFYLSLYFLHRPDPNHLGFGYVIAVFGAIWVGDTAAMVAGLRFGRHRFFSRISPKKTVEGAVAELLASTVFFAIVGLFLNISFPHNVIIGLLIGVFAEVGDLVESQIKRTAGVKDASQLIPGHGGVLDRIDSLLLVGVVVYYYVTFLHLA